MDVAIIKPFGHKNLIGKEQEIVNLYYDEMAPMSYIADTYECSCDTITKWFKSNNLRIRTRAESLITKGKFRFEKDASFGSFKFTHPNLVGEDDDIRKLYINDGYSVMELCDKFEVAQSGTFVTWMKRNGIKVRNPKEARVISRNYDKQIKALQYKFTEEEIQNILLLYKDGYSAKFIADSLKIDSCVIFRVLGENNIDIRRGSESMTDKSDELRMKTYISRHGSYDDARIKGKQTIMNNGGYGPSLEKQKRTMLERYGCENCMQVPEYFHKNQKTGKRLKRAIINGKVITYQGFELLAIYKLLSEGYSIDDIIIGKGEVPNFKYIFGGKNRRYYPDIYIPKDNRVVEVKSKWTYERELDKNLAKREAVMDAGYEFDFYIMGK